MLIVERDIMCSLLLDLMRFTLLFDFGTEGSSQTYDLVYIPGPVWMKNGKEVINLSHKQYFVHGDFESLLKEEQATFSKIGNHVKIIIYEEGHGILECLAILIEELISNGFSPEVYNLDKKILEFLKHGEWIDLDGNEVNIFSKPFVNVPH